MERDREMGQIAGLQWAMALKERPEQEAAEERAKGLWGANAGGWTSAADTKEARLARRRVFGLERDQQIEQQVEVGVDIEAERRNEVE